ncbi:fungal-specific transcription factor [Colletotrichum somersetense]|nr:fungal-specific transcription factor [Colletotrichum somersetense]
MYWPSEKAYTPLAVAEPSENQLSTGAKSTIPCVPHNDVSRPAVSSGFSGTRLPLRSSIACLRCRKSKIKCDNDNNRESPCYACVKAGQICEFLDPTPPLAKLAERPTARKRKKNIGHTQRRVKQHQEANHSEELGGAIYAQEVLSAPYLTVDLWHQLFDIYMLHFATELPFLHLPTLKEIIHNKENEKPSADSNLILLGVLALTARFQSGLVKYVVHTAYDKAADLKPRGTPARLEPRVASEYFAGALIKALGGLESVLASATVVRVQALLMLAFCKWSQPNGGLAAWMYIGVATRMAQGLNLGLGDKALGENKILVPISPSNRPEQLPSDMWKDKEIKRRTMFSCLILDRLLSCGSDRVSMIRYEDLQIKLPCTEHAFDLGRFVYTGLQRQVELEMGRSVDKSILGQFVQLIDLWGDIKEYISKGGRHTETLPPWNMESTFYRLNNMLEAFYSHLPENLTLSRVNLWTNTSSTYVSLHMLGALCKIMLHREYIPFFAIKCHKPLGPLDKPFISPIMFPEQFWNQSAEQVFKAGREIIELILTSRYNFPYSPLVVFAIWQAAFISLYARHYPHMDTKNHIVNEEEIQEQALGTVPKITPTANTSVAFQALTKVAPYFTMASNYMNHFRYLDRYFTKVFSDYTNEVPRKSSDGQLIIRLDGGGGGAEEWQTKTEKITSNSIILKEYRQVRYEASEQSLANTLGSGSSMVPEYLPHGPSGLDSRKDFGQIPFHNTVTLFSQKAIQENSVSCKLHTFQIKGLHPDSCSRG